MTTTIETCRSLREELVAWSRGRLQPGDGVDVTASGHVRLEGHGAARWSQGLSPVRDLPGFEPEYATAVRLRVRWRPVNRWRTPTPLQCRLHFLDHRGRRLRGVEPVTVEFRGRWLPAVRTDTSTAVAVPTHASCVKLDLRLPPQGVIEVRDVEIIATHPESNAHPPLAQECTAFRIEAGEESERTLAVLDPRVLVDAGDSPQLTIDDDGALVHRRGDRNVHHQGIIGSEHLFGAICADALIGLRLSWKPHDPERIMMRWKIRLHWTDHAGRICADVPSTTLVFFADRPDAWTDEIVRGIPVPPGCAGVKVDPMIPRAMDVTLRSLALTAPSFRTFEHRFDHDLRTLAISLPPAGAHGPLVSTGAIIDVPGASNVRLPDGTPVPRGTSRRLGNMVAQGVFFERDGACLALQGPVVDLFQIDVTRDGLRVRLDAWHIAERTVTTTGETDATGTRHHGNLALRTSARIPDELKVAVRPERHGIVSRHWAPAPYRATLVLTEHADWQTTASERAVMDRGLLPRRIPISKSVFLCPPPDDAPAEAKPISSLDRNDDFAAQIGAYDPDLVELALHTFGQQNAPLDQVRAALGRNPSFHFHGWIDHGAKRNLPCLVRCGAESGHRFAVLPILRDLGIEWAWSYLDFAVDGLDLVHDAGCNRLLFDLSLFGEGGSDVAFFSTVRLDFRDGDLSADRLDTLIERRGVSLVHCYLSINRHGHLRLNEGVPRALAPWFERDLDALRDRRDSGALWLTTMGAFARRVRALRRVVISELGAGHVVLDNPGPMIGAFSFEVVSASRRISLVSDLPSGRTVVEYDS